MELRQVKNKDDFAVLYTERKLETVKDKIDFLQTEMDIFCTRFESGTTDEDILLSLQQHALQGWPKRTLAK